MKKRWLNASIFIPVIGIFLAEYHSNKYNHKNSELYEFGIYDDDRLNNFIAVQILSIAIIAVIGTIWIKN